MKKRSHPAPSRPSSFGASFDNAGTAGLQTESTDRKIHLPTAPKGQFRRAPFYLKIEGLTGPRPHYDEAGRMRDADPTDQS